MRIMKPNNGSKGAAGRRCRTQLQPSEAKKSSNHMPLIEDNDHKDNSDEDDFLGYYDEYIHDKGFSQDGDKHRGKHAPLKIPLGTPPVGKRPHNLRTGNDPDGSFEREENTPMETRSCKTPGQARKRTRVDPPDSTGMNRQMTCLALNSADKEVARRGKSHRQGKGQDGRAIVAPNLNPFLDEPKKKVKRSTRGPESVESRYLRTFEEKATLGSGSFCSVYMCRHRLDGCMYAVKRSLHPLAQNSAKRKAMKEVFALAAMADCEYIARYFNVWGEDEQLYIQLELGYGSLEAALMGKRPTRKLSYAEVAETWRRRNLEVPLWVRIMAKRCGVAINDNESEVERILQNSKFTPGSAESVVSEEFSTGRDSGQNMPPEIYRPKAKTRSRYERRESYDNVPSRSRTGSLASQESANVDQMSLDSDSQMAEGEVKQALRFSSPTPTAADNCRDEIASNFESQISAHHNKEGGKNLKQTFLSFARKPSAKKAEPSTKKNDSSKPAEAQPCPDISISQQNGEHAHRLSQSEMFQFPASQDFESDRNISPAMERLDDERANDGFYSEDASVTHQKGEESNHSEGYGMSQASMCSLEALSQHYEGEEDPFSNFDASYRPRLPCSEWDLRRVTHDIAAALAFMHGRGLVHLDVKPANILVNYGSGPGMCDQNGDWLPSVNLMTGFVSLDNELAQENEDIDIPKMPVRYKLADLGQATRLDDPNFEEGDSRYTSKELMQGNAEDIASCDMFALGLMIYELATGAPLPMGGEEYHRLREGHLRVLPQCTEQMKTLIAELMSPEPHKRPRATEVLTHPLISSASPFQAYARHCRNNRTGSEGDGLNMHSARDPTLGSSYNASSNDPTWESPDPLRHSTTSGEKMQGSPFYNSPEMTIHQLSTETPSRKAETVPELQQQLEQSERVKQKLLKQLRQAGMEPHI
eukprot:gb/GECG01005694.1/.p1 GENE.gb/GECG01005694.1/~~gb/GECG01005694.1/.p1  ORF type:complete len:930 (+),score=122.63 gb/GECG01005694.1/:1-2790(+)